MSETIVLMDSEESARRATVEGWVSRDGRFYGSDERTARYAGATHRACEECGAIVTKHRLICGDCTAKKRAARYATFPLTTWGEGPASLYMGDEYFFDEQDALDYAYDNDISLSELQLVACEPVFATEIDPTEHYADDVPEHGEVPSEIEAAFATLNAAIRACKEPLCWRPVDKRIVLTEEHDD